MHNNVIKSICFPGNHNCHLNWRVRVNIEPPESVQTCEISSGEPVKAVRRSRKYLVSSFWKRLCRPHRRPPRSGTLRRCRHTPGRASWEWRWACTRTWLANRLQRRQSTPRSVLGRPRHLQACLGWTLAGSRGRVSVCRCRWCSRRWRRSCRWDCGDCRCLLVRKKDWKARFWRKNHSLRTGVGPQRAFWLTTWMKHTQGESCSQ